MRLLPVIVDWWEIECCGKPLSPGDQVSWSLEFVPAESATCPAELLVDLDAAVETVKVLQPPDCARGRAARHYQFLRAGPVHASWTAPEPYAGPMPIRGALVAGWHGGGVEPKSPPIRGVIERIRVLRQNMVLDGPRARLMREGAQLREVTTSPTHFASADVPVGSPGHWKEMGIVTDIEVEGTS